MVTQTDYFSSKPLVTAELRLENGEIFRFGNTVEEKNSDTDQNSIHEEGFYELFDFIIDWLNSNVKHCLV